MKERVQYVAIVVAALTLAGVTGCGGGGSFGTPGASTGTGTGLVGTAQVPGSSEPYVALDLSSCAVSDYHCDPFSPKVAGSNHYKTLTAGTVVWGEVPFTIAPDYTTSGTPSTVTTCNWYTYTHAAPCPQYPCPTNEVPVGLALKNLHLAVCGGGVNVFTNKQAPIAEIVVNYADGQKQTKQVYVNQDVWEYHWAYRSLPAPDPAAIVWEDPNTKDMWYYKNPIFITGLTIPMDNPEVEVASVSINCTFNRDAGISVFAMTGETDPPTTIEASIEFSPAQINTNSGGGYLTAVVELAGEDPAILDPSSMRIAAINGQDLGDQAVAPSGPSGLGDLDLDGIPDLQVSFDRPTVIALLESMGVGEGEAALAVTGSTYDGVGIQGSDTVRVINPGPAGKTPPGQAKTPPGKAKKGK